MRGSFYEHDQIWHFGGIWNIFWGLILRVHCVWRIAGNMRPIRGMAGRPALFMSSAPVLLMASVCLIGYSQAN